MKEESVSKIGGGSRHQAGPDLGHLGRKLRELFDRPPEPLPQRLLELLDQLAAKDKSHPQVNKPLKDALLSMIPNLRAFALSPCGDRDRADDLVQETLLKAWAHMDSFQEGTNLLAWLFTILRNTYLSEMRKRRRVVQDSDGKKAEGLSVAPAQQGRVDMEDMRKALGFCLPINEKRWFWLALPGCPTRRLPSLLIVQSAPSRAGSTAPASSFAVCSASKGRMRSVPTMPSGHDKLDL
jgi:RNA polymerase sigma factor (sigma-70 family)